VTLILKHIGCLVTLAEFGEGPARGPIADLATVSDGFLLVDGGRVQQAGSMADYRPAWEGGATEVRSLPGMLVTPGLIDPHTHAVFAGWRADEFARRLQGVSYQEIMAAGGGILRSVASTRAASEEELFELGMNRLDQMLRRGVTTVEIKSGYGLDLATELRQLRVNRRLDQAHPIDVVSTYLGAHLVPPEFRGRAEAYVDFVTQVVLPAVRGEELAEFCDVFCDVGAFSLDQARRILLRAAELGMGTKLHADELEGSGGAELAAELGAISGDHLLRVSDAGIAALAGSSTVAVLLPGTSFFLRATPAPARRLIDRGIPVALATDFNPGSCPLIDLRMAMTLGCVSLGLTPAEALAATTLNAAHAVGRGATTGSLREGKWADLVVWDCPDYNHLPYFLGSDLVGAVYKRGRAVYGGPQPCSSLRT
jgi:imidazolonepropionase